MTSAVAAALKVGGLLTAAPVRAQEKDIVDTAVAAGQFKTLAAAIQGRR